MSIAHIVSSIDNEASGPAYSVPSLARALANGGQSVDLFALGQPSIVIDKGLRTVRCKPDMPSVPFLSRLGLSQEMLRLLCTSKADVFHSHGLWMMPNVYSAEAARRNAKPYVISPRGMLGPDALKFSRAKKWVFWTSFQRSACSAAACFHATAESEYEDIRNFGLRQPVTVLPNGIDLPDLSNLALPGNAELTRFAPGPFILSLGRLHPKKGLERLISAFSLISTDHPEWRLRIVGPDEVGHAATLKRLLSELKLNGRVSIEPPVFGQEKFRLMRQADVFALPTLHENFGMTVAESLAVETPVVSTKGAPWAALEDHDCGWWVDHEVEAIAAALHKSILLPKAERDAMGVRGRKWMQRDFAWDGIGSKMFEVYSWLLGHRTRPEYVHL